MARGNNPYGRAQSGATAWAPAFDGTRRPAGLSLPDGVAGTAGHLRGLLWQWLLAELAPGRLMPWVPIAFGAGIACYFAADREPHVWAILPLAIGAVAVAFVARRRPFGFPLAVGIAGVFAGLAIATLQAARIAHPILQIRSQALPHFPGLWRFAKSGSEATAS